MKNYRMDTSNDAVIYVGLQMITDREPSSKQLQGRYVACIAVNAENVAANILRYHITGNRFLEWFEIVNLRPRKRKMNFLQLQLLNDVTLTASSCAKSLLDWPKTIFHKIDRVYGLSTEQQLPPKYIFKGYLTEGDVK